MTGNSELGRAIHSVGAGARPVARVLSLTGPLIVLLCFSAALLDSMLGEGTWLIWWIAAALAGIVSVAAGLALNSRPGTDETSSRFADLARLLELTTEGIVVVDSRGVVQFANTGAERTLGAAPGGLLGTEFDVPATAEPVIFDLPSTTGEPPRVAQFRTSEVNWGRELMQAAVIRDVTGVVESNRRMTRALEGHERFLRGVSREIRNPLTAILGFSEILSVNSAGMSPEEIAEISATIVTEANAISALVDDLLVTARADPWSLAIVNEAVSIDQTIRSIVRDDMVVKHHSAGAVMAWGDPIRIRQVLRNLINHAHRHGGERAWIELSQSGSSVRVSVCDDGPGIPDEHVGTMFEPYAGAPRYAGERESVGLGLHVARLLARRMGGDVRHHREEPITRIELTLPRSAAGDRGREHSPAEQ